MFVYCGSDDFALEVLKGIFPHEKPLAIVTQPDRPSGRGHKMQSGPLALFAKEHNITLLQPSSLKDPEQQKALLDLKPDLFIVVSFGQILPKSFLEAAPCVINAHASILPNYRGASPMNAVILNGEKETGVSLMHITPPLDAGPVFDLATTPLSKDDTLLTLSKRLQKLAAQLLLPYAQGKAVAAGVEQNHAQATFCHKIHKDAVRINPFLHDADLSERMVRAFNPRPAAFLMFEGELEPWRLKVLEAKLEKNSSLQAGEISTENKELRVGFKNNQALWLTQIQPQGKGIMPPQAFLNGLRAPLRLAP